MRSGRSAHLLLGGRLLGPGGGLRLACRGLFGLGGTRFERLLGLGAHFVRSLDLGERSGLNATGEGRLHDVLFDGCLRREAAIVGRALVLVSREGMDEKERLRRSHSGRSIGLSWSPTTFTAGGRRLGPPTSKPKPLAGEGRCGRAVGWGGSHDDEGGV